MGSNTKFKRFLTEEKVDSNLPIKSKYKTKAVIFYRKNLKTKVEGKKNQKKIIKMQMKLLKKKMKIYSLNLIRNMQLKIRY